MTGRPSAHPPASRREAREQSAAAVPGVRRDGWRAVWVAAWQRASRRPADLATLLVLMAVSVVAIAWAVAGAAHAPEPVAAAPAHAEAPPPYIDSLPVPTVGSAEQTASAGPAPAGQGPCADAAVQAAIAAGDDDATVAAFGGGEAFRSAVASSAAPCIRLDDPARVWTVVNKQRPYGQVDYVPSPIVLPSGIRNIPGGALRSDAAGALQQLVAGAAAAGAGEIAIGSAYRSYTTQQSTYADNVAQNGQAGADAVSARPGFSEHQSGLAVDLSACVRSCGAIEDFGPTDQGRWVAQHAWEYGYIVRYEDGRTAVTGYAPEPWHLRYIGPALARAYHDGGWHTLEEFFGLPPAPDYAG